MSLSRPRNVAEGGFSEHPDPSGKEFILYEFANHEAWICGCGNTPVAEGVYSCDSLGNIIEPDHAWDGASYVCDKCGRIIHQGSLEVVGRREPPTSSEHR